MANKKRIRGKGFGPIDLLKGLLKGTKSSHLISQLVSKISPSVGATIRSYGYGKRKAKKTKK